MEPPSKRPKRAATSLSTGRLFNCDSSISAPGKNIQAFLAICLLRWEDYSNDERASIVSTLPPPYQNASRGENGHVICPITPGFVSEDKVIRDQIARFKREVKDGYYTKTWQEKAKKAMDDRSNGKFDEYLVRHAEEMFNDDDNDDDVIDQVDDPDSDGDFGTKASKKMAKGTGRSRNRSDMGTSSRSLKSEYIVETDGTASVAENGDREMNDVA